MLLEQNLVFCCSLLQELVGQYFFREEQLDRFHKLHTTMRKCGIAFVVVSAATVAGLIQVLPHQEVLRMHVSKSLTLETF